MTEDTLTDAAVRRFLLGEVDDDERQRIEGLFISDPEANEKILIAEEDLVEDYLEDALTPSDRRKFLAQYRSTPQQRRKLRIARSIKEYTEGEGAGQSVPVTEESSTSPRRRSFFSALRLKHRIWFIPLAAALAVAISAGVIWLVDWNNRREESSRRQSIERELVELNVPSSLRNGPPPAVSLLLPPVSLRSAAPPAKLTGTTSVNYIELRLLVSQKEEYLTYQAVLRRVGNSEQYAIHNLQAENKPDGHIVRLRIPAHLLTRGLYQVDLTGVGSGGKPEPTEEYTFAVGD